MPPQKPAQPVDPWGVASVAPLAQSDPWGVASVQHMPQQAAPIGGDLRPLTQRQRFETNYPVGVQGEGVGENIKNFANNVGVGMWNTIAHPIDTVTGFAKSLIPGTDTPNPLKATYDGLNTRPADTIASTLGQSMVMAPVAELAGKVGARVLGKAKRVVTGDVNAPILPGHSATPLQRYTAMKDMGINPDAAEATNSPFLSGVKRFNQNSLTSQATYTKAQAANLKALQAYTDSTMDSMSPLSPEEGGAAVKAGLVRNHDELKQGATLGFQTLDDEVGDKPMPGAAGLQQQAKNILDQNTEYYRLHPQLEPSKALSIVRNLSKDGTEQPTGPKVVTGFGSAAATPPVEPRVPTYTELHRLRSDLLDFNNTNPDLVKNQSHGWVSQLAGAADNAITSGENALTPPQVDTFRNANESWKYMKDNFDNPQSPLYSAVRTQAPSTLVNGISKTPEMAGKLRTLLTNQEVGPIQRGVAEGALKTTKDGTYNFKTFQGQFNKLAPEYRQTLFSPPQLQSLNNIGQAGSVLNTDLNPSGSAKLGQGIGEGAAFAGSALHPPTLAANLAYHAAQYLTGKAMNSSAVVNALMRPPIKAFKAPSLSLYGAAAGASATPKR